MSDKIVIDNEEVILRDEVREYLEDATQASIAVGYFFISGFAEIMDSLKRIEESDDPDHGIRLLISPTTNRPTVEALLADNEAYEAARSKCGIPYPEEKATAEQWAEFKRMLEHMPQSEKEAVAIRKLIDLIRRKKVQVRVYTKVQLHAKAYVFELDNKHRPRVAIVGSSNLSISGIRQHAELNLAPSSPDDARAVREWFDRHWNDESCKEFTEEMADVLGESWAGREHTPADVYGKAAIHEHGDDFDDLIDDSDISADVELFNFQKKAVSNAINKIRNYDGVIIADVVGMGKSFMGSAILKYLKKEHETPPLIICPPHLKDMWEDYMERFGIYEGRVVSRYKIGMDDDILQRYTHYKAVLIDESHNFRHANTNAYKALLRFMEGKADGAKVIMLTATPISNKVRDLKNQLKLFPREGQEKILAKLEKRGAATLDEYFKGVEDDTGILAGGAEKVHDLLQHVLIRRTRTQIREKYALRDGDRWYLEQSEGRKYFPDRRLRNPEEYDADRVYNNSYEQIEKYIGELILSRYAPGKYVREGYEHIKKYEELINNAKPMVGIVRTSLLKRMESSIMAFDTSVRNYVNGYKAFRKQLAKGVIPIGKEFHDEIYKKIDPDNDYDADDFEENMSKIVSKYEAEAFDLDLWIEEIDEDLKQFGVIRDLLTDDFDKREQDFVRRDDKLHKLGDLVERNDEKILIFTESAVTAKYAYRYLESRFPGRRIEQIDSKQNSRKKDDLVKRFDPANNNADIPKEQELDILVSTDVLSEGVNLHAGRIVINYDFHWNPVRLIQRVGRVDRIGSEHPMIDIHNFLPTTMIDSTLSLRERVAAKIQKIRQIIGHDQQILEATEAIDEESVIAVYNPDENGDDVLNANIGILDVEESEAEKHADDIRRDEKKREYYEKLHYGIRSASGRGKLLIACEAEEDMVKDGVARRQPPFRRHYEVVGGEVKKITPSSFLKQVGINSKKLRPPPSSDADDGYNDSVARAWAKFNRDAKDAAARTQILKHQEYFEKKLRKVGGNPDLAGRAMPLALFVTSQMRENNQPYTGLVDLHRKIDADPDADDAMMIEGLERIMKKHGGTSYKRQISRPRILYSMMVDA